MQLAVQQVGSAPKLLAVAGAAVLTGGFTGYVATQHGLQVAGVLVMLPLAFALALRSIWFSFSGAVAAMTLLPFAVAPAGIGVSPTLLSLALLATLASLAAVTVIDRREHIVTGGPQALVLVLLGVSAFALLLGVGRGYTFQTLHDYAKFVLAICSFFVVVQLVRALVDARRVLALLLAGTGCAGFIGLALYAGGPAFSHRVLARLIPFGYPSDRIVRYIEDNPGLAMRAVGTGVDPNSFGGLLMVGFVLAASQLLVRKRSIPVWLAGGVALLTAATMLLTYSRGAWMGALAGIGLVVLLRRPILVWPGLMLGGFGLAAGVGAGFVNRLWLGFTLQDPATRLRLAEYRNAWDIIRRHPWFGVGFGDAPSIDLQVGVSSVYLTVAERAGLIGLLVFLLAVGVVGWRGLRYSIATPATERGDLTLTLVAALAAMLTVGLVDHYFFNPQFPHMAALLWIVGGCIVAVLRLEGTSSTAASGVSSLSTMAARRRSSPEPARAPRGVT